MTEDGREKVNYEYGRLGNIGATDAEWKGSRQPVRGMYCLADDAVEIIERIVAPVSKRLNVLAISRMVNLYSGPIR